MRLTGGLFALCLALVTACGSTDADPETNASDSSRGGAASGVAGANSAGLASNDGGRSAGLGGAASSGETGRAGGAGLGGSLGDGGSSFSGGANARGGAPAAGGAAAHGGAPASGGATSNAGSTSSGGAPPVNSNCKFPAPAGSPVAQHGQLKVVKAVLQDQSGNPYQLKGVSSYWLNWESTRYAESKSALQYMRDNWKLSAFRAAMGTDASSGYLTSSANATALQARIETIVENALALGVYVLVDWHTEKAASQQDKAIAFFTGLAQKYGACPNLIYEDYNEPTGVTWAQIKPYHQAVVSAVRAIDSDNLIVMGTPNWSQDVDLAALDPVSGSNLLYTLHWYACSHKASLRAKGTTAISRGVALFVTESAATSANGGVAPANTVCEAEATSWYTWMADNHVSGIAWKLASGTDSSNLFASGSKPPADGPFPDSVLSQTNGSSPGHGQFAVNWMRN